MRGARWVECIDHYDDEVDDFFSLHFSDNKRSVLFVAGAGFDPRAKVVVEKLQPLLDDRLSCALIKEERPDPHIELIKRASSNLSAISKLCKNINLYEVQIIAEDNAVIGGNSVARQLSQINFGDYTDIIIDLSALSIGVSFPVVKLIYLHCEERKLSTNIHLVVVSNPELDGLIKSNPTDRVTEIRGYSRKRLLGQPEKAVLWLPQLVSNRKAVLQLLYADIKPHDVCPILPFFPSVPKKGDHIVSSFLAELSEWSVDPRNFIYADETNPLDIYRSILEIHDQRGPVFETFGGSAVILSPLGSKVLAIGALMAAIERDLPVLYVETLSYEIDWDKVDKIKFEKSKLTHIWLSGEAYIDAN